MIRPYRYAHKENHRWEMPGGGLRSGESPEDAAQRELREEAGDRAGRLAGVSTYNTTKCVTDEVGHLYLGFDLEEDLMNTLPQGFTGWESFLQKAALVIARLALGYLFFTQLWWKVPPTFDCPDGFVFKEGAVDANRQVKYANRSSGLCDWIGIESVWASAPHPILVANLDNQGKPEISVDIGLLARANGAFIDSVVKPNIRWFGYAVWGMEAFIFVSLFFGLFSRLGGLVAIAQSAQLWVGLSGIGNPNEWEWSYNMFVVLALLVFAFAPGRVFGVDAWLRPMLKSAAEKGNRLGRLLLWLT